MIYNRLFVFSNLYFIIKRYLHVICTYNIIYNNNNNNCFEFLYNFILLSMRSNNANLSLFFHWIGCNAMFLKIFVILIIQR